MLSREEISALRSRAAKVRWENYRKSGDPGAKKCSACGDRKPHWEFGIDRQTRDGRRGTCKRCIRERERLGIRVGRARLKIEGQRFGKLTVLAYAYSRKRITYWSCRCDCGVSVEVAGIRLVNGGTTSCGCARYRKQREASEERKQQMAFRHLFRSYSHHADGRGLAFELAQEHVATLLQLPCEYCGQGPSNVYRRNSRSSWQILYSGIDRVDNTRGYVPDNVVPCCASCNIAKNDMPLERFREWLSRAYARVVIEAKVCPAT